MKNTQPEISIVIPVYNGATYLRECLESLSNQSFQNFECIIVDDGSTDLTPTILQNYTDTRFVTIKGGHRGSSTARNIGAEQATGTFIIFLDSDDIFHPDLLTTLHSNIVSTDSDISICNYRKLDTATYDYSEKILQDINAPDAAFAAIDMPTTILNIFSGVPWNKLYRKKFLNTKRLDFLDGLVIGADSLFVHKSLLSAGKICYSDDVLIDYRVNNPKSDVARAGDFIIDISRTISELNAFMQEYVDYDTFRQTFDNWAIGKCVWIYSLSNQQINPIIRAIIRQYQLDQKPDSYYQQPSAIDLLHIVQAED